MSDIQPLEDKTLNQLKEELGEMGYADLAATLSTKSQVLGVIAGLKTKPATPEEVVIPKADPTEYKESASEERKQVKAYESKKDQMRRLLEAQPKVQIYLPLEGKEKQGSIEERIVDGQVKTVTSGAIETVILNGYTTYIPKGRPWPVPAQVAEVVGQGQVDTAEAGRAFELDRADTDAATPYGTIGEALA